MVTEFPTVCFRLVFFAAMKYIDQRMFRGNNFTTYYNYTEKS